MSGADPFGGPVDQVEQHLLERRAQRLRTPPPSGPEGTEQYLVLRVADHRLAVPAARVRHVTDPQVITTVPDAPAGIVGIVSVLGELFPVADLATLLGVPATQPHQRLLIVDDGDEGLGLLVGEVDDVVALDVPPHIEQDQDHATVLAGAAVGDVRLLSLDALLADQRLAPPASRAADAHAADPHAADPHAADAQVADAQVANARGAP